MKQLSPDRMAAPLGAYSQGVEVPPGARWLVVSGQVGVDTQGAIADGIEAQSEWVWRNLTTCLEEAGMGVGDIVKVTTYLLDPSELPAYGGVRSRYLGDHRPASTLVYVSALVKPELRVEVEVLAARAD